MCGCVSPAAIWISFKNRSTPRNAARPGSSTFNATTVMSYGRNRRALSEKVNQELRGTSSETARAIDQWLDERLDELHVSASSYILAENVGRTAGSGADRALPRLRDYLASARERF